MKLASHKQFIEECNDGIIEDEEEALSLSDLPLIGRQENADDPPRQEAQEHQQQDFDFCSTLKESEMCSADDVFFKGQILPLSHSISSVHGSLLHHHHQPQHQKENDKSSPCRSVISRSASLDRSFYSRSLVSSSRSSSINSNSSTSSSNTALATPNYNHYRKSKPPLLPPRSNHFQYNQPSPSPRFSSNSQGIANSYSSICSYEKKSHSKKSSASSSWNVFKLGLVTIPPEILNAARPCNNTMYSNFGSRNSASSSNSSSCNSSSKRMMEDKNKKHRAAGFFGGWKCSTSIDDVRDSRIAFKIKRSASENEVKALFSEEDGDEKVMMRTLKMKKKRHLSHRRTFEWLKQLSIEGGNDHLS